MARGVMGGRTRKNQEINDLSATKCRNAAYSAITVLHEFAAPRMKSGTAIMTFSGARRRGNKKSKGGKAEPQERLNQLF